MLQRNVEINLWGERYLVDYPNVGQKMEIESAKMLFSNGIYGELVRNGHKTAGELLDIIDAFSYFSIMIPTSSKRFTREYFEKLELSDQLRIREQFRKYYKFVEDVEKELLKEINAEDKK